MKIHKIIYRVVSPVVGKEPMVCGLGEYPNQQFTSRLGVALGVFEACAAHTHVVLQEFSRASGEWIDMDAKTMLAQRQAQAAAAESGYGSDAECIEAHLDILENEGAKFDSHAALKHGVAIADAKAAE